ncbi:MAG: hypothetical protein R2752_19015 [Vicinamibacterales bacterium]
MTMLVLATAMALGAGVSGPSGPAGPAGPAWPARPADRDPGQVRVGARLAGAEAGDARTLHVAVEGLGDDGTAIIRATTGGSPAIDAYLWSGGQFCSWSAGSDLPPATPAIGWHVTGRATEQGQVAITWERVWDGGVRLATPPRGSSQVVLGPGEDLEVDGRAASADEQAGCGVKRARLVVRFGPSGAIRGAAAGRRVGGVGAGAGGSGSAGQAGGRGRGASAQGTGSEAASGGTGVSVGAVGGGSGRGSAGMAGASGSGGSGQAVREPFDIELWLVHREPPGEGGAPGRESVQQITLERASGEVPFSFPSVDVGRSPSGETRRVQVFGSFGVLGHVHPREFFVHLGWTMRINGEADRVGTGVKRLVMPAPGDVVELELPTLRGEGADARAQASALAGHEFAVRVRIRPSAGEARNVPGLPIFNH